jgi:hypothetical protein
MCYSSYGLACVAAATRKTGHEVVKAQPFNKMAEGMLHTQIIEEAASLMWAGIAKGLRVNVLINNRAGGNAPPIAK